MEMSFDLTTGEHIRSEGLRRELYPGSRKGGGKVEVDLRKRRGKNSIEVKAFAALKVMT